MNNKVKITVLPHGSEVDLVFQGLDGVPGGYYRVANVEVAEVQTTITQVLAGSAVKSVYKNLKVGQK